jgi:hypothetical protein
MNILYIVPGSWLEKAKALCITLLCSVFQVRYTSPMFQVPPSLLTQKLLNIKMFCCMSPLQFNLLSVLMIHNPEIE